MKHIYKIYSFFARYWLVFCWVVLLTAMLLLGGCRANPVAQNETINKEYFEKTIYKDSLIYVKVPYERIVEKVPYLDTLRLSSTTAEMEAWLDTTLLQITGHLVSKDCQLPANVKVEQKTIKTTEYKNIIKEVRIKEKISFFEKFRLFIFGMCLGILLVIIEEVIRQIKKK